MLFFYVVLAWFSEGYSHVDEHYQILEFAAYKIHHYPYIYPWELDAQIRPTLQVWIVVWISKALSFFSPSPFLIAFLTRVIAGVLSAASCYLFINAFKDALNSAVKKKWFFLLGAFSYTAAYCAVRYSSEGISASLFLIGFSLLFYKENRHTFFTYFVIGLLLGASFITRYQTGLMIFGLIAWLFIFKKIKPSALFTVFTGLLFMFALGMYLDALFYGKFVCTAWRYFEVNILENRAAAYGTSHWKYLNAATYLPYGPLYILSSLFFIVKCPKHVITWVIFPFILFHMITPHQEMRFLIPILGFMPFIIIYSLQIIQKDYTFPSRWAARFTRLNKMAWAMNCIMLFLLLSVAHDHFGIYKFIWQHYKNQSVLLSLYTTKKELLADNRIELKMPLRFYLSDKIYAKNNNDLDSIYCEKGAHCLVVVPCYQALLQGKPGLTLLYDACPSDMVRSKFNIAGWMDRSAIFRHSGRVYEIG
jgi:phosphatidylinositol glycan class B